MKKISRSSGFSMLETVVATGFVLGAMHMTVTLSHTLETNFTDSERTLQRTTAATDLLDRLDGLLRTSSLYGVPLRVQETTKQDDLKSFLSCPQISENTPVTGVWFTRLQRIDAKTIPPRMVYAPPARVYFRLDEGEKKNGIDDNGDGWADEGSVVLEMDKARSVIARGVLKFEIQKVGRTLHVTMHLIGKEDGRQGRKVQKISRVIYPRNG